MISNLGYRTVSVTLDRFPTSLVWAVVVSAWSVNGGRFRKVLARGTVSLPEDQAKPCVRCYLAAVVERLEHT